jgi:hypothetical protein
MNDPVTRSIVSCGDEYRITLSDGEGQDIDRRFLNVSLSYAAMSVH